MADTNIPDPSQVAFYVDPSGQTVTVPKDQAGEAQAAGYSPATSEQIQAFQKQVQYGSGVLNPVKAGAAAAARTATFGLSDQALTKSGAVDPETLQGLEDANPVASTIGTGIGAVAPALVGDEAGVASALNPIKAVSRLGKAAEGVVSGVLPAGESLASKIVSSAASKAVGSAIEGAAYGAGDVVSEQALGDPSLTAQSAIAHVGLAGVLGGGLGGLMGVGEEVVPEIVSKAKDSIANAFTKGSEAALDIAKGLDKETPALTADILLEHRATINNLEESIPGIRDTVAKLDPDMAQLVADNPDKIQAMYEQFPKQTQAMLGSGKETAEYLLNNYQQIWTDPAARSKAATEMTEGMQDVLDHMRKLQREVNGKIAPQEVEKLLEHADPEPVMRAYNDIFERVNDAVARSKDEPELFDQAYTRHLEKLSEGMVRDADVSTSPVEAFNRMQTLRQSLDELAGYGKMDMGLSERQSINEIRDLRGMVKKTMTDPEVFGELAARKAAWDTAQADFATLTKKGGEFQKRFMEKVNGKGGPRYVLRAPKIGSWLNQMADQRGEVASEVWGRTMQAAKQIVDEAETSFRNAPVGDFDRGAYDSLLNKTRGATEDASQHARATHVANQLDPKIAWGSNAVVKGGDGLALGALAANHFVPGAGAVIGTIKGVAKIGQVAKSVPRTVAVLSHLERFGKSAAAKIDTGVKALMNASEKSFYVGRGEVAAGLAREFGRNDPKTMQARLNKLADMTSNPEAITAALNRTTDGLHEHAPNTAEALSVSTARALSYLQSKAPKMQAKGLKPFKVVPSKADVAKFGRTWHAVHNPSSILKMAQAGVLTPDAVEAVRTCYPEYYGQIQKTVFNQIVAHPNKVIPFRQKQQLGMLLGAPMDSSRASLPANQQAYASAPKAQQAPQGPKATLGGLKSLSVADRALTPMQSTTQRES